MVPSAGVDVSSGVTSSNTMTSFLDILTRLIFRRNSTADNTDVVDSCVRSFDATYFVSPNVGDPGQWVGVERLVCVPSIIHKKVSLLHHVFLAV